MARAKSAVLTAADKKKVIADLKSKLRAVKQEIKSVDKSKKAADKLYAKDMTNLQKLQSALQAKLDAAVGK